MRTNFANVDDDSEVGLFFLVPLLAASVKAAAKALQQTKAQRKAAEHAVKQQARVVRAAEQSPGPTPTAVVQAKQALAAEQAKLATAAQQEAAAHAAFVQAKAEHATQRILPNTTAAPVAGVVIGNIYRPIGRSAWGR